MSRSPGTRAYEPCFYCTAQSGSREHILAKGIGGWLTRRNLVCERHNGDCGRSADDPLCEQFAFAVHSLEVRKDDGTRGACWQGLKATDGTTFDILPDFRARMRHTVERPGGGFRITATDPAVFTRLGPQIAAIADPADNRIEARSYSFSPTIETSGAGLRGILKAAFHFVGAVAAIRDKARDMVMANSNAIFGDAIPPNVVALPYGASETPDDAHSHEMIAWSSAGKTFVKVRLFNIISYLVELPFLEMEPHSYHQNTRNGSRTLRRTAVPEMLVYEDTMTQNGFQREFARRVDVVVAIGLYKGDVRDILDAALLENPYRRAIGPTARASALENALRERFCLRPGFFPSWAMREVLEFAKCRIDELSKIVVRRDA